MGTDLLSNNGRHIHYIIETTSCRIHKADKGDPCHTVTSGHTRLSTVLLGVCGPRIKRAGYDGKISATAMQNKRKDAKNKR